MYVRDAFTTNWVAPIGPNVDAFEQELCNKVGATAAVALSSGTAAIHLGLKILGVQPGDEVFCSTLTFVASANPILYLGAEPVFIDSEPKSWNMSPIALKDALEDADKRGKLPKAVVVVNLYGQSADMDPILELCSQYQVPVLEDAAESLGASYKGKPSGTFGKIGVFSFNGNKIITTSGGGMLVCHDVEVARKVRHLAAQAREPAKHYEHVEIGYNYRLSNVLAGIGRGQLEVLESRVEARRNVFKRYTEGLSHIRDITFMPEYDGSKSNRWLTTIYLDHKSSKTPYDIIEVLDRENIESRPVWKPLHLQPLFSKKRFYKHPGEIPVSETLFKRGVCLPSGSSLGEDEQDRVINTIKKIF